MPIVAWLAISAVVASIAAGDGVGTGVLVALAGTVVGLVVAGRGVPVLRTAALVVATALVVVAGINVRTMLAAEPSLQQLARDGGITRVEARVVTEPRTSEHGWWALVEVRGVRALLRGPDDEPPELGVVLVGEVGVRPLGTTGFDDHLRSLHARFALTVPRLIDTGGVGSVIGSSTWLRTRVRTLATAGLSEGASGLAAGLVTGDTRLLPADAEEDLRDAGLTHLVAVSGSNVALVLVGVLVMTRATRLRFWPAQIVIVTALAWFALLTRFEPSVLRATVMAVMVLAARWRGVASDPVHALSSTVLLLLLVDPRIGQSLGLLLSVAATVGVLVVGPAARRRLPERPAMFFDLVAITIGAQVAVLPVLLSTGEEVGLAAVPANMVAVPLAAVASTIALIATAVGVISVDAGGWVMALAGPALEGLLAVGRTAAGRGPTISTAAPFGIAAVLALSGVVVWWPRIPLVRRRGLVAVGLVATVLVARPVRIADDGAFRITAIDVGQGDAVLVSGGGRTILVDGGPDGRAAAWLRAQGHRRIDLVVATHPHADHVDGLVEVMDTVAVGALWWRPLVDRREDLQLESLDEVTSRVVARSIPSHRPATGDRVVVGPMIVDVLGPPTGRPYRWTDREANESSVVLRITMDGRRLLLTGDVERAAQQAMLDAGVDLRADVLKVPHHGGGTSLPAFLAAPSAALGLISLAADNTYGHPHADTLAALAAAGTVARRTDLEGTVSIRLDDVSPCCVDSIAWPPPPLSSP